MALMINKVKELAIRVSNLATVRGFATLIGIAWAAFSFSDDFKSLVELIGVKEEHVYKYMLAAFLIVLTCGAIKVFRNRIKHQKEAFDADKKAEYNEKVYSIAYEIVTTYRKSEAFQSIVNGHRDNVNNYFNQLSDSLRSTINKNITKETLRRFDKVKGDFEGQKALMNSVFREFSDISKIEAFLRLEHRNCLNNISNDLNKKIRANKIFSYSHNFNQESEKDHTLPEFEIDAADIEFEIDMILKGIPDLSFANLLPAETSNNDLTIAALIAAGMTAEDIADILKDIVGGESAELILKELLDYAGTFIPYFGQAVMVIKIFKFLYSLRDRSEDLKQLREEIYQTSTSYYREIDKHTQFKINTDSILYLESLASKFKYSYKKAKKFRKRNQWYL